MSVNNRMDGEEQQTLLTTNSDVESLKQTIAQLKTENTVLISQVHKINKKGNPAVVGLAGFGATTLLLQIHNLGLMGLGAIVWLGLIFGGLAQFIAGIMEFSTGNNFGFCAFTSYGAFWISFGLMVIGNRFEIHKATETDIGYFLLVFTLFTLIMLIGAARIHLALFLVFASLVLGFVLLDFGHFLHSATPNAMAGISLILSAFGAWYIMAHLIYQDVYGKNILPVGKPFTQILCEFYAKTRGTRHDASSASVAKCQNSAA